MIVRKALTWIVFIGILCRVQAESDRWSRQISNSEWIPLANPRNSQRSQSPAPVLTAPAAAAPDSNVQEAGQVPVVSLPPALQKQYQEQLLQLQKTQESIQKLLLLQQQLKTQQQILQSQAYQPNDFANAEDDKQALHQSTIVNLQTLPDLAPEVLVPPVPSSEALPPVFQAQDFHPEGELKHGHRSQFAAANSPPSSEQDYRQDAISHETSHPQKDVEKDYRLRQKNRYENAQRHKDEHSHGNFVTPSSNAAHESNDEQEEIQLVYVPAETLAQRGQNKLHKSPSRKHHPNRHHQHREENPTTIPSHDAYAREILQQLQRQHDEKNQYLLAERQKEITRLNAEQKELERQARLHQEAVRREQELMRQREADKKRKELEKIEEAARQRELHRLQELREKERLAEERNLAELMAKEEEDKRLELEKLASYNKEKDFRRQKEEEHIRDQSTYEIENVSAQPLIREQQIHHQHLTEISNKNVKNSRGRNKPRNKLHHFNQPQDFNEQPEIQTTTPPPNQPPLSVYMGTLPDQRRVQLVDVLKTLKNARSIAVLDSFGPDTPRVFVGPRDLDTPPGYSKFDLPYLSSIENNRVERKVDKLPFFVAPLSFDPPPGYSKIPFPAPHIGSVVINSLENVESKPVIHQSPNPNPLIEPNSYVVSNQPLSQYDGSTPVSYAPESSTPRYEASSLPASQPSTKWRFRDYYDNKPATEIPSAVTAASYQDERTSDKYERPSKNRNYYNPNEVSTTPNYYSPKTITQYSFESVPQSTPSYHEEPTREHNVDTQYVDPNVVQHRPTGSRYRDPDPVQEEPVNQRYPVDPTGHTVTNSYYLNSSPNLDEQTQYNLPAELPAISPQLPGLVNALVEKVEIPATTQIPTTTPPPITTTTTETPTTTYRPRSRQRGRVTASRTATTLSPPARTRRPVNRSRSKYTTTTEDYRDSSYDPTRRNTVTTSRYDDDRSQSSKSRDKELKESFNSQIVDSSGSNEQGQRGNAYESVPLIDPDSAAVNSGASGQAAVAPTSNLNFPVYQHDDYAGATVAPVDNFSRHRDGGASDSIVPLSGLDYSRKSTLAPAYHASSPSYSEPTAAEEQSVNGFNYRTHESPQTTRDFAYYTTDSPNVQRSQLQDFSPVYQSVSGQEEYDKNETPRPVYRGQAEDNNEEPPIFLPIPHDKQEEYAYQTTVTDPLPEVTTPTTTTTTTTTTTEAPVIIRQRVRGRLSGRPSHQQDSAIQTRPRGSQDEYVRFSAVNQDSGSRTNTRQRSRPRTRVSSTQQQRQHQHSPIQTDGQEYVRIQSAQGQQRRPLIQHTTQHTTQQTTRAQEEPEPAQEEEEYGFIRTPNYRPSAQSVSTNYKTTQAQQIQTVQETTVAPAPIEPSQAQSQSQSQAQLLKTRQKYYSATRRPSGRATTTHRSTDDGGYTERPRNREEANKATAKSRGRLRRPASRRRATTTTTTTTTTETPADLNELPLDENYPRLQAQDLPVHTQNDAYNEQPLKSAPRRGENLADENYPQEFLLNFGASQGYRNRDDYEDAPRRPAARARPHGRGSSDIYGAESQWSTKLTGNSFQPSSYAANQPEQSADKDAEAVGREKAGDLPEIITAGPDVDAITVRVSADQGNDEAQQQVSSSSEESILGSMLEATADFGKKVDEAEGSTPESPTTTSTETAPLESKSSAATFKKAGLRRRRVRVRVRPAASSGEDFVTAESQSFDSSLNHLSRDPSKFRNFFVTTQSSTTAAATTTTTSTTTESPRTDKSIFESFLDKMLGGNEEPASTIPPDVPTTISPDDAWTNPSTIIPAEVIREESTTLGEVVDFHRSSEYQTTMRNAEELVGVTEVPATTPAAIPSTEAYFTSSSSEPSSTTTTTTTSKPEDVRSSSGENSIQTLSQENSLRYFVTKSPAFNQYLRSQDRSEMAEDDPNHPKNHRSKWSEVRYPTDKSLFDFAKWNNKNQSESSEEKSSANGETDTVTDYVKAIFESIKSADEEHHQSAKLADEGANHRQVKEIKPDITSPFPTEVKTSVSSSSRVVSRPAVRVSQSSFEVTEAPTTTTTAEAVTFGPFVPSMMSDKQLGPVKKSSLETNLGKILKTTTTTKVSHMTEICYRGRCVMSKPKKDGVSR